MSNSAPFLFKCSGESEYRTPPTILKNYEEAIGVPRRLVFVDGGLVADFSTFSVLLPPEIEGELRPLLGQRIGVLRVDTGKPYRIRVMAELR